MLYETLEPEEDEIAVATNNELIDTEEGLTIRNEIFSEFMLKNRFNK